MKLRLIVTTLVLLLFISTAVAEEIMNVRYWAAPDHTRIVVDTSDEPFYDVEEGANSLILKFKRAGLQSAVPAEIAINKPGIKKIVISPFNGKSVKMELFLDKYFKTEVFKLKKFQDKPNRVVVDVILEKTAEEKPAAGKAAKTKIKPTQLIVIDPGHGGEDPGAIGKKRTYEKNIVLCLSQEIQKEINKIPGYQAVLTRDGDYYVSFRKRLQMAKDINARLFISVHADAARNAGARGSSVYCLSTGAASSEAAKLLANNENLSDVIGGVPNGDGGNESDSIILNMFQTNTINLSKIYAGILLSNLDKVNSLKYRNVQEAPFRVLKLPDIPAVLVETAYISNKQEERLLKNDGFQKKMAAAVAASAVQFLGGGEKETTTADVAEDDGEDVEKKFTADTRPEKASPEKPPLKYKVKRGDTLFSIARQFNIKVGQLLKLNNMKLDDPLVSGQKIIVGRNGDNIPVPAANNNDQARNKARKIYTVKKGDTLFSLAKNNSTTVDEILKINNMKPSRALYTGQKIKLP